MSRRHQSNVGVGLELEDVVSVILQELKDEGHIIKEYRLLNSQDYPDFYVLDAKGRDYLLECKNLNVRYRGEGKHLQSQPNGRPWVHNYRWTRANILNKEWDASEYFIAGTGKRTRKQQDSPYPQKTKTRPYVYDSIRIRNGPPNPILIISHFCFDADSTIALLNLFARGNIIVYGEQLGVGAVPWTKQFSYLLDHLRRTFTGMSNGGAEG